jgi:hypothetical protein
MTIKKGTKYFIILDTGKDAIKFCDGKTLEEAKTCSKQNIWVLASVKDKFMKAKEKRIENKLSITLVTKFADIQKDLYRLTGNNRNGDYNIVYDYKKINSSGVFENTNGVEEFTAKFDSATGTLHVTGTDPDGKAYDRTGIVYKYDLSGKTIKKEEFTIEEVFGRNYHDDLASHLPNTSFKFEQVSSMYCPILDGKCFVDKATINQMLEQAGSTNTADE